MMFFGNNIFNPIFKQIYVKSVSNEYVDFKKISKEKELDRTDKKIISPKKGARALLKIFEK